MNLLEKLFRKWVLRKKGNGDQTLIKIADHLYEITYTDDFDWDNAAYVGRMVFGCSGVQNGQYRGRNYDWICADTDCCVVRAAVTEKRHHASIGVTDLSFCDDGSGSYNLKLVPFCVVDGINDAGVCIQVNVIPYGENGALCHTKTRDDDLFGAFAVRYILDNADSVEDAVALIKAKDVHPEMRSMAEVHWMISGPADKTDKTIKTVVVEVFPDGIHIVENFVDDRPIMTNFSVSGFDGSAGSAGLGSGYERWQILSENYDQADSVAGTFDLMKRVHFSKLYDLYSERFWYSKYNGADLSRFYSAHELREMLGKEAYDSYKEKYGGVYYNAALYDGERKLNGDIEKAGIVRFAVQKADDAYKARKKGDTSLWMTVHTCVYDLENRTLDLQIRESRDHLHFEIN